MKTCLSHLQSKGRSSDPTAKTMTDEGSTLTRLKPRGRPAPPPPCKEGGPMSSSVDPLPVSSQGSKPPPPPVAEKPRRNTGWCGQCVDLGVLSVQQQCVQYISVCNTAVYVTYMQSSRRIVNDFPLLCSLPSPPLFPSLPSCPSPLPSLSPSLPSFPSSFSHLPPSFLSSQVPRTRTSQTQAPLLPHRNHLPSVVQHWTR